MEHNFLDKIKTILGFQPKIPEPEQASIGHIEMHHLLCAVCNSPMRDKDLVISNKKYMGHAHCVIQFIHEDMDPSEVALRHPMNLVMTLEEFKTWCHSAHVEP
jgi:hypothetical protein